ncbi:hypothetical protein [Salibacterium qingdaonense]|uniref:Uncharacterized protein n=1 Tax=Salibacterium qingdaonense TaxID=266892 RepID=A0A1I4NK70_9BACI|nr:hypothetical protein [Salibacterium qingdaonense]SFM15866.1 hypothetical protein SAMN04488054_11862 [Salibacterium qingdaonense]
MNIFMVRSKPHGIERMDTFLEKNLIAVGWTSTGDLTHAGKEEIRSSLLSLGYEDQSLRTNLGLLNSFVNTMEVGDLVLIRKGETVHIGKVGEYSWREEFTDLFMAHTRSVTWITKVPFEQLNAKVQSLLKNIRSISKFKHNAEEAELQAYLDPTLRDNAGSSINKDLYDNTIEVLKDLMNNAEDEGTRLEAAKELMNHLRK